MASALKTFYGLVENSYAKKHLRRSGVRWGLLFRINDLHTAGAIVPAICKAVSHEFSLFYLSHFIFLATRPSPSNWSHLHIAWGSSRRLKDTQPWDRSFSRDNRVRRPWDFYNSCRVTNDKYAWKFRKSSGMKNVVSWDMMMPCGSCRNRCFRGNVGSFKNHTASSYPRRQHS
jgi:hypothetical protein